MRGETMDEYPYPITIDVSWTNSVSKGIQNKLQIYFQSKKKSSGGDCLVHYEDQRSTRATVYFKSEDVRESVLSRDNHEITVDNETVKLRLSSSSSGGNLKEACTLSVTVSVPLSPSCSLSSLTTSFTPFPTCSLFPSD
uniref:PAR14-like first RRM domain-containing protein n=1 Tax=Oncorhynchus mykiss TaxID=8022 RepID=A0A8C7VB42_ONCMY